MDLKVEEIGDGNYTHFVVSTGASAENVGIGSAVVAHNGNVKMTEKAVYHVSGGWQLTLGNGVTAYAGTDDTGTVIATGSTVSANQNIFLKAATGKTVVVSNASTTVAAEADEAKGTGAKITENNTSFVALTTLTVGGEITGYYVKAGLGLSSKQNVSDGNYGVAPETEIRIEGTADVTKADKINVTVGGVTKDFSNNSGAIAEILAGTACTGAAGSPAPTVDLKIGSNAVTVEQQS